MKKCDHLGVLLAILLAAFLTQAHFVTRYHTPTGDEGHFIEVAENVLEGRGYSSRLKHHFYPFNDAVVHPDDTRQPLVPTLFALLFAVTGTSYVAAKILLICCNVTNVFLIYRLGRELFDRTVAGVAAAFVGLLPTQFFFWTGMTQPAEPPFTLFLLMSFWISIRKPTNAFGWIGIGLLLGLCYLTRANGLWLAIALIIYAYVRRNDVSFRTSVLSLLSFVAVCIPWLFRNTGHFGNPIYTSAQHNYWMDTFWLFNSYMVHVPSLASYVESHTFGQMLERAASGLYLNVVEFVLEGWGVALFLPLALIPLFNRRDHRYSFLLIMLAVTFTGLIWYAPAYSPRRFYVPFHPPIVLLATGGLFRIANSISQERIWRALTKRRLFIGFALGVLAVDPGSRMINSFSATDAVNHRKLQVVAKWLQANMKKTDTVMATGVHQLIHEFDRPTVLVPNNDFPTILHVARRYYVDYLVVNPTLVNDRTKGFYKYWQMTDNGLQELSTPESLDLVFAAEDRSTLIYRLE